MAENLVSPPPQTAPQPPRAAPQPPPTEPQWTGWHTLSLLVSMMLMVLAGVLLPTHARVWAWIITLTLLTAGAAVAGQGITGFWCGLLIDERNKISLSRFADDVVDHRSPLWLLYSGALQPRGGTTQPARHRRAE
jgi:hypothetical protein